MYRVGGDEHIDFVGKQRARALELELLFDINIDARPRLQIGCDGFQQPLVAGVAFHADAQQPALSARVVAELFFKVVKLRQHAAREAVQPFARLGQAQVAPFFVPQRRAELFFQFFDGVAQRRLREVEAFGSLGEGAVFDDGADDVQVVAFEHGL